MPTFEEFYQNFQGLAGAAGGVAGKYAANELFVKPALERKRDQDLLDRAIFNQDFATASAIAKRLGLIDDSWDYQTAEREIPTQTPLPITTGSISSMPTNPAMTGVPQPSTPMPLSDGLFASMLKGQNLATNPLGLKGTFDAAMASSLVPGKSVKDWTTVLRQEGGQTVARDIPVYGEKAAPLPRFQDLGKPSLGGGEKVSLYDFTPARELYRTENLLPTESNIRRLMSLYGGKVPEAELKTNYNDAILQIRPGYGFIKPSVVELAPGGIPSATAAELKLREQIAKEGFKGDAAERELKRRAQDIAILGQDLDYRAASIRASRAGASDGLTDRNKIKIIQDIIDDGERLVNARRREFDFMSDVILDQNQIAARNADIYKEAARSMASRAYATGDPDVIARVNAAIAGMSAVSGGQPGTQPAAPTPAPTQKPLPPSPGPVGAPPVPAAPATARPVAIPAPVPAPAPRVRPSVLPPVIPPTPSAPGRQTNANLRPGAASQKPSAQKRTPIQTGEDILKRLEDSKRP